MVLLSQTQGRGRKLISKVGFPGEPDMLLILMGVLLSDYQVYLITFARSCSGCRSLEKVGPEPDLRSRR